MIFKNCPKCGSENPETAKYCNECGAKLSPEETLPPSQQEPIQTPSQPVPSGAAPPEPVPGPFGTLPEAPEAEPILLAASAQPEPVLIPAQTPTEPSEHAAEEYPAEEPSSEQPFGARFNVIAELGSGTLGTVYKVFDKAMERELVLRAIRPEISQKAEAFEGFTGELRVERGIVHKNVARIFELNTWKGTPFITMEYVPGRGLRSLLKEKKRLPVGEVISIAKQLFSGLAQVHKAGALHLDLRPENIMIDKEGTVKIMDLGIARFFRAKGIIRSAAGMPQYMSPEQLQGEEADASSDLFAGGVMVYEMLTGNLPAVGAAARNPREFNPDIFRELSRLVLRCIEQEKGKRYQTAEEIRDELEAIETIASEAPAEVAVRPPAEKPAAPKPAEEPMPAVTAEPGKIPEPARTQTKTRRLKFLPLPSKMGFPALVVAAAVILAVILWKFIFGPSKGGQPLSPQPPQVSLAVLPFEDLSPAEKRQYLGSALAETLIRMLGKIDNLFIPAAESSSSFRGKTREARQVGGRLQVDHYLEGTFEAQDDRIKVDARLLRADSGAPLWSGQYERNTAELPAIQEEIGRSVSKSLGIGAPLESGPALSAGGPANFEAYDFYAQARFLIGKKGKENLEKACDLFAKSGDKDPVFAQAFVGLADAYMSLADGHHWTPDKAIPKAKEAALKALLLDSGSAEAHTALGRIKTKYEWDFTWAEKEYLEALRLDPDNATAHQYYALLLSALGRHGEAAREIQLAQTQNPLCSEVNAQAGTIRYFARFYEEAAAEVNKALATDPLYPGHHLNAALVQIQMGQLDEAGLSLREAEDLGSDPSEVKLLRACIHARQGQRQEVGRLLTEVFNTAKKDYVSQVSVAMVYAGINEKDQAIACLENAFAGREASLIYMRVHPFLDPVRGDARFVSLLRKIGLGPS